VGGLGSAAAYWLSRKAGKDVLGIEQFELGHVRGESQDHSRIIRKTYHTVPYVRFAQEAYRAWDVLEEDEKIETPRPRGTTVEVTAEREPSCEVDWQRTPIEV